MPITIIKKRPSTPATVPEPLVNPRPPEPAFEAPLPNPTKPQAPILKHAEKPIAKSIDDFKRDPNGYRSPPRRACTFCGHSYSFPCDGQDKKCMNAKWVRDMQAREGQG